MPRPRSEDRRNAILSAGARVIASQGLAAPTAAIAKEAGVSNGSLFVYFDTKAALLNELYVALKTEMAAAATAGLDAGGDPREQVRHMWTQWLRGATSNPEKRRPAAPIQESENSTPHSPRTVPASFPALPTPLLLTPATRPMRPPPP